MTITGNIKRAKKPRVPLSDRDLRHLAERSGGASIAVLARRAGLPYIMVYNVVRGRVKSVSDRHYRMLFGKPPAPQRPMKVDGDAFRKMARLWLFLNDGLTKSNLYRELYGPEQPHKTEHRIFSGKIKRVDARLEYLMRKKFADANVEEPLLGQWLEELDGISHEESVSYDRMRPVLKYLQDHLGVHPTAILNQTVVRYESGELKHISRKLYDRALTLKKDTENALDAGDTRAIEKLKETISGTKSGYTLYLDIREELQFLHKYAKKSIRGYLGRSQWTYERGRVKRVADWRARKIMVDCDRFIRERPDLPLSILPRSRQKWWIRILMDALLARVTQMLSRQDGVIFEKRILTPLHKRDEYTQGYHGLTSFDIAPSVLGMKRKAFDLMVAKNCEIFRTVGTYSKRWYLSDLYLQELSQKRYFNIISAKYELMARKLGQVEGQSTLHALKY